jgi:hypothetical protein
MSNFYSNMHTPHKMSKAEQDFWAEKDQKEIGSIANHALAVLAQNGKVNPSEGLIDLFSERPQKLSPESIGATDAPPADIIDLYSPRLKKHPNGSL